MEPKELATRCQKVGLKPKQLAGLAGLHTDTVKRTITEAHSPRFENLQKMDAAVTGYEVDLLRHLANLHPQEAIEAATVAMCPQSPNLGSAAR